MSDERQPHWLISCHEEWVDKSQQADEPRKVRPPPPPPPPPAQKEVQKEVDPEVLPPDETWGILMDNLEEGNHGY